MAKCTNVKLFHYGLSFLQICDFFVYINYLSETKGKSILNKVTYRVSRKNEFTSAFFSNLDFDENQLEEPC